MKLIFEVISISAKEIMIYYSLYYVKAEILQ